MSRERDDVALELDDLISEITVDCYDDDEALMGFEAAFDEVRFPISGTVVGEDVQVISVGRGDGRRELVAAASGRVSATTSLCSTSTCGMPM